jgi:hypothetical protein
MAVTDCRGRVVVFGRSRVQISAGRPPILTVAFRGLTQSLQEYAGIVLKINPLPLPSTSLPIYHTPFHLTLHGLSY